MLRNIDVEKLAIYQLGYEKGFALDLAEGRARAIAIKLLELGMEPERIAVATQLSIATVEALQQTHPPGHT